MYVYRYIYTNTYISEHRLVGLVKRLAWSLLNGWRSWTAVHYKYIHIINTRICTHTYANVYVSEHGLVGLVKRLARFFYMAGGPGRPSMGVVYIYIYIYINK